MLFLLSLIPSINLCSVAFSSISERCGKLKLCYFNGSITAFPIIETIANDITEYTATNIISITDRLFSIIGSSSIKT